MEAPKNSCSLLSNADAKERQEGERGRLTLGPAELSDGVDEALVQVGRPTQSRLGVCRQHQARPARAADGAGARCPIAGRGAVWAVVDQTRREHLLLLLCPSCCSPQQQKEERQGLLLLLPPQKQRIQSKEKVPRLSLSPFLRVLASLQPLPLSTGSDSWPCLVL